MLLISVAAAVTSRWCNADISGFHV